MNGLGSLANLMGAVTRPASAGRGIRQLARPNVPQLQSLMAALRQRQMQQRMSATQGQTVNTGLRQLMANRMGSVPAMGAFQQLYR